MKRIVNETVLNYSVVGAELRTQIVQSCFTDPSLTRPVLTPPPALRPRAPPLPLPV